MRAPVMHEEWQRRQTQRSVWALLGLLAVLTHVPVPAPAGAIALPPRADVAPLAGRADAVSAPRAAETSSSRTPTRYWRALAAADAGAARVDLSSHPAHAVNDPRDFWLRRLRRPPTA
jgi:hypothetical protein